MIYLMSDIHGDYKNFCRMLKKINFGSDDRLYILGDVIDKGNENLNMISCIRGENNICLIKGNHEYLCERYLKGIVNASLWDACGGSTARKEVDALNEQQKEDLKDYLESLALFQSIKINGEEYFLTHSGYRVDFDIIDVKTGKVDIEKSVLQAAEDDQERYLFSNDIHFIPAGLLFNKKVIVGHYPTIFLEDFQKAEIYYGRKYIDIDTGNDQRKYGGRLACLRADDWKAFYI